MTNSELFTWILSIHAGHGFPHKKAHNTCILSHGMLSHDILSYFYITEIMGQCNISCALKCTGYSHIRSVDEKNVKIIEHIPASKGMKTYENKSLLYEIHIG